MKKMIASVVFGIAGVIATQAVIEKIERAESKNKNKSKKKDSEKDGKNKPKEVEISDELMEAVGFQTLEMGCVN